jgi:hypothetical protein
MFHGISDAFVPIQPCHDFVTWFKATDALLAHVAAPLN